MKCTHLDTIEEDLFSHLGHLQKLDLSNSGITTVKDGAFNGLQYLRQLYLQTNSIITYGQYIVKDLINLVELHTDTNNLCCPHYRPARLENCFSPEASISSCKDLMANSFLRVAIWVLCIATLTGNILSIGLRICWERRSFMNGYSVFVTHLAVSDFIMGLYLLIIAIADTRYQGIYVLKDQEWRSSVFCKIAGFLSTLSSEASALFISLITVDRFLVIKYPFQQIKITFRSAMAWSVLVWIAAGVIAGIPLLPQLSNWEFYNKNGACLAVPFFTEKKPGWIYSACVFIGLNFVAFIFIAFGQYSIYRKIKEVSVMSNQDRGSQDVEVAKRLLLIVSTDFLCWFPVGIMSLLALTGIKIGVEMFAWTAVFILPVNSALNPFLYAVPAVKHKMRMMRKQSQKKETETNISLASTSRRKDVFVKEDELDPNFRLLEDLLLHLNSVRDKMKLIEQVMAYLADCTAVPETLQIHPNAICVWMRRNVVVRVCVSAKSDHQCSDWTTVILSLLEGRRD
ncbi:G-protein coupled receptor GRL101-like [Haliotis rufescens]|uniref:G-protein coupled receptor GRL101-like n=1 Tax=Haliotis rufescens TaxID=6454 RepID=UPI00201F6C35|nr:G-protein coupled receptor GRL101-like [Haliotis rufescens]